MNAVASNIRPAASVLVLRDGARGVEVLLMRRPERGDNDFRSGACVFPGGVLDAADSGAWRWCLGQDDAMASARLGLAEGGLNYFVAALRECFEEVGLLFVCQPDGSPADLARMRRRCATGATGCTMARRRWPRCARPSTGGWTCARWPTSATG